MKREAKQTVEAGLLDVQRWWCQKYNRPPNDPLYQARPTGVWVREMYEDAYERKRHFEGLLDDPELKQEERRGISTKLRNLCKALGETAVSEDQLVEKWERELAEGITPDLDEAPPDR